MHRARRARVGAAIGAVTCFLAHPSRTDRSFALRPPLASNPTPQIGPDDEQFDEYPELVSTLLLPGQSLLPSRHARLQLKKPSVEERPSAAAASWLQGIEEWHKKHGLLVE